MDLNFSRITFWMAIPGRTLSLEASMEAGRRRPRKEKGGGKEARSKARKVLREGADDSHLGARRRLGEAWTWPLLPKNLLLVR